jgi:hypothetical protein
LSLVAEALVDQLKKILTGTLVEEVQVVFSIIQHIV